MDLEKKEYLGPKDKMVEVHTTDNEKRLEIKGYNLTANDIRNLLAYLPKLGYGVVMCNVQLHADKKGY